MSGRDARPSAKRKASIIVASLLAFVVNEALSITVASFLVCPCYIPLRGTTGGVQPYLETRKT